MWLICLQQCLSQPLHDWHNFNNFIRFVLDNVKILLLPIILVSFLSLWYANTFTSRNLSLNSGFILKISQWFTIICADGFVTVQPSLPKMGWFHFQSTDCIYLWIIWLICYQPILCFLNPDNRSIASWSLWSVSKWRRPHN